MIVDIFSGITKPVAILGIAIGVLNLWICLANWAERYKANKKAEVYKDIDPKSLW